MLPTPSDLLSIYFCGCEQCAPNHFFGPAVRPHYLIHIVLHGTGIFQRNSQLYHLHAGDAFLISPLESTYYQADSQDPWKYIWVGFDGKLVPSLLKNTCFEQSCIYRCPEDDISRKSIAQQAVETLRIFQGGDYHSMTLAGEFLKLLGLMQEKDNIPSETYPQQYLAKAKDYMENNFSYNIRIADIATSIGIDRTYLYRIFMENEHQSPKQYLFQLRIRIAVQMLQEAQYTITEIAYSCGFRDASAFCNDFKRAMGVTPRQFRNNLEVAKTFSEPVNTIKIES